MTCRGGPSSIATTSCLGSNCLFQISLSLSKFASSHFTQPIAKQCLSGPYKMMLPPLSALPSCSWPKSQSQFLHCDSQVYLRSDIATHSLHVCGLVPWCTCWGGAAWENAFSFFTPWVLGMELKLLGFTYSVSLLTSPWITSLTISASTHQSPLLCYSIYLSVPFCLFVTGSQLIQTHLEPTVYSLGLSCVIGL